VGTAAVALPVAIHFLTKPRPTRLPLSTLRFVQEAIQQKRARYRLRDWIILLLRTAAVILLALAFARPLLRASPAVAERGAGKTVRVLLLDVSQSMAAASHGGGGVSAFDRARAEIARHANYDQDVRINLIEAGARPRPLFDRLTTNFSAVRDELAAARVRGERLNLQKAIDASAEMLAKAPAPSGSADLRRELVIVSDFQRSNWADVDFSPLPKNTIIQLESVAPPPPVQAGPQVTRLPNLAITQVRALGRLEQRRPAKLEIEVGNFSPAARDLHVDVTLGNASYQAAGLCPPGVKTPLLIDFTPSETGWQSGAAALTAVDDALDADNHRSFVLEIRPAPTYALITRDPAKPQPTSSHFLERALAPYSDATAAGKPAAGGYPAPGAKTLERVVRIDPRQQGGLDRDALAPADLIVLDHPGRLSNASINLLAALVRRGKPMLYVTAEPTDASNLKLFADAEGADLKMPVEFLAPSESGLRRDLFLVEVRRSEIPFSKFGESLAAAVGPLRFAGGLNSRALPPEQGALRDDILATYSDRSAALIVTTCGAGSLAVLNADLNRSNIASSGIFVPLIDELVGRLLAQRQSASAIPSGEPMAAYLPAETGTTAGLAIGRQSAVGSGQSAIQYAQRAPESEIKNSSDTGEIAEESNFVIWRWPAAGPPGIYQVKRDGHIIFAAATAVPASESDLQTIDPSLLTDRLAGGRQVQFRYSGDEQQGKDNTWTWIATACAACILTELLALIAFRT
jgi:hypothetical protein